MQVLRGAVLSVVAATAIAAAPAAAQPAPPPAGPVPSYARPEVPAIHGRIATFDGHYDLTVRDDRGYVDHVQLHDGTVISPLGLTLAPGMRVTIHGRPDGQLFLADEVDTPYHQAYPAVAYYPYPYPYGPYYGYPYWGWGPDVHVGLGFHFR